MIGFQAPAAELELAKAVRDVDIATATNYRLARAARRHERRRSARMSRGGFADTAPPVRPVAGGVGAPRRSSG